MAEKCSICRDYLKNPRLLPCIHTFCLECLERYCRSLDKLPENDVPCPECRKEFNIPKKGVALLPVGKQRFSRRTDLAQQLLISNTSGKCLSSTRKVDCKILNKIVHFFGRHLVERSRYSRLCCISSSGGTPRGTGAMPFTFQGYQFWSPHLLPKLTPVPFP